MDKNIIWYNEQRIIRTIKSLYEHNMEGHFVESRKELFEKLEQWIPQGSVIGVGDSMTLFETGVIEFFRNGNFSFLDKYREDLSKDEKRDIYIKNFSADTFVCSTNAITEKGELFNIDGNGSRVAPMLYGPKQVILVAGVNKLVKNLQEAEIRVRQYAAPIDAKRLNKATPCTKTGYCVDCKSPSRICNDFVTITGQFVKGRIKIIIVNERLGY
ncbi:MAG: lactate utilization protein [Clostridiales bacterium]|uniref:lactate utilization protein n=1 Tax=Aminipila sp. TaxID=2060095 RepID=UPI001DD75313|nr:lactate utilization protein [Aminipila sp.]MBE6035392.1 lactate utilization protein [Clostridiales bacterium]